MTRDPGRDGSTSGSLPTRVAELPRILIVEDNDDLRRQLAAYFTSRGWSVEATRTLHAALAVASRQRPAVIVTELLLPDVRGYRFADDYRRSVGEPVAIIALTRMPAMIFDSARKAGFDRVFAKPADLDALYRCAESSAYPSVDPALARDQ